MKKLTTKQFIEKAKSVQGNKYNYSKVNYVNAKTKVCIICPEHGEFWQTPDKHQQGRGCPKCADEYKGNLFRSNIQEFIQKAKLIHGNKYNYSQVNYIKATEKVEIICSVHGSFWQTPNSHLNGYGCIKCARDKMHNERVKSNNDFVSDANKIHNYKYDYSKIKYFNAHTKVTITCPIHGDFEQTPHDHLSGRSGCPICASSKGEQEIEQYLIDNKINYITQFPINIDKTINKTGIAKIDFYLPEYNCCIEYNGIQHYKYIPYFHSGGKIDFEKQKLRDEFVRNYCINNNIKLIEIKYTDNILNVLTSYYNKN